MTNKGFCMDVVLFSTEEKNLFFAPLNCETNGGTIALQLRKLSNGRFCKIGTMILQPSMKRGLPTTATIVIQATSPPVENVDYSQEIIFHTKQELIVEQGFTELDLRKFTMPDTPPDPVPRPMSSYQGNTELVFAPRTT